MGFYDVVRSSRPELVCGRGHVITDDEMQTKDLGCTMGVWTLEEQLKGAPGAFNHDKVPRQPFTGVMGLIACCDECWTTKGDYWRGFETFKVTLREGRVVSIIRLPQLPEPESPFLVAK